MRESNEETGENVELQMTVFMPLALPHRDPVRRHILGSNYCGQASDH